MKGLKSYREKCGLSQRELAKKVGLHSSAVSHFETGTRKPSLDNLCQIADALKLSTDYLIGRTDEGNVERDMCSPETKRITKDWFINEVKDFVTLYCSDHGIERDEEESITYSFGRANDWNTWFARVWVVYKWGKFEEPFLVRLEIKSGSTDEDHELAIFVHEDGYFNADEGGLWCHLFHETMTRYRKLLNGVLDIPL